MNTGTLGLVLASKTRKQWFYMIYIMIDEYNFLLLSVLSILAAERQIS